MFGELAVGNAIRPPYWKVFHVAPAKTIKVVAGLKSLAAHQQRGCAVAIDSFDSWIKECSTTPLHPFLEDGQDGDFGNGHEGTMEDNCWTDDAEPVSDNGKSGRRGRLRGEEGATASESTQQRLSERACESRRWKGRGQRLEKEEEMEEWHEMSDSAWSNERREREREEGSPAHGRSLQEDDDNWRGREGRGPGSAWSSGNAACEWSKAGEEAASNRWLGASPVGGMPVMWEHDVRAGEWESVLRVLMRDEGEEEVVRVDRRRAIYSQLSEEQCLRVTERWGRVEADSHGSSAGRVSRDQGSGSSSGIRREGEEEEDGVGQRASVRGRLVAAVRKAWQGEGGGRGQRAAVAVRMVPPLTLLPPHAPLSWKEYVAHTLHTRATASYLLALLSADSAALAIVRGDQLTRHKVLTAYTVRACQGRSQSLQLRHKPPGRMSAGAALRMRESQRLLSEIAQKLDEWHPQLDDCTSFFYSGSRQMLQQVLADASLPMQQLDNAPVGISDPRWVKLPFHVGRPRMKQLQQVLFRITTGHIQLFQAPP